MAGPMPQLVEAGSIKVDRPEESGLRRDLNVVHARHVAGARAADSEVGAGRRDQDLSVRDDRALGQRRRAGVHVIRQAVALRDIEYGEALEERHGFRLITVVRGALALGFRDEAVGVADGGAALALAHAAAEVQRLTKGEPMLGG